MNELGLVSDLCEKSNKGEIMNCFIGQLEVSYIMFKSFLLKPTENNFPLRVKMCKEHMRTEKHISSPPPPLPLCPLSSPTGYTTVTGRIKQSICSW